MLKFLLWLVLLILLLLWPLLWLLTLPFRLVGVVFEGMFELLRAIVLLPARILGGPGSVRR
jgi:hypothetical protein